MANLKTNLFFRKIVKRLSGSIFWKKKYFAELEQIIKIPGAGWTCHVKTTEGTPWHLQRKKPAEPLCSAFLTNSGPSM